ncbi:hypothetical protein [Phenylobacterium sp.]|uniref:hypothetical protein n=1 Tax=Phenylobacterium sp. TaxID=1871053 RepID=UPI0035630DE8
MQKMLSYAALAAALAIASPVLAQTPSSGAAKEAAPQTAPQTTGTQPPAASGSPSQAPTTTAPSTTAPPSATAPTGTNAAANAGASVDVASGMSVKDNTGTVIGQITAVKGDQATIKMGADTFTVDVSKLGVQGGAANINATQAEIKKMLPAKK